MARKATSPLASITSRRALPVRGKPYTERLANGLRIALRRNKSGDVWSWFKSDGKGGANLQRFAHAESDSEPANGSTVLTYDQACDKARELFRAGDPGSDTGHIATVGEAVDAFERDLANRDGRVGNATWLRFHLAPATLRKPVCLLT